MTNRDSMSKQAFFLQFNTKPGAGIRAALASIQAV